MSFAEGAVDHPLSLRGSASLDALLALRVTMRVTMIDVLPFSAGNLLADRDQLLEEASDRSNNQLLSRRQFSGAGGAVAALGGAHFVENPSQARCAAGLAHCFAGCETGTILAAVGLRLTDLFLDRAPETGTRSRARGSSRRISLRADRAVVHLEGEAMMLFGRRLPPRVRRT
jgi:hypothetical protein